MGLSFRLFREPRGLKPNEVQAKIPMIVEPTKSRRSFRLIPVRDPEIYPLLVCVGLGITMLSFWTWHTFAYNPDVSFNRKRRHTQTMERLHPEESEEFTKHHHALANLRPNPININEDNRSLYRRALENFGSHKTNSEEATQMQQKQRMGENQRPATSGEHETTTPK